MSETTWQTCKNILCVCPDNMGDVLMASPALRAIKESLPDVRLTLLASPRGSAIAPFIPEIDDVIMCRLPWDSKMQPDSGKITLVP